MTPRQSVPPELPPRSLDGVVSRRQFLFVSAALGGGLLVQVACRGQEAADAAPNGRRESSGPSIFIRIAPDDTVYVTIPKSEMGQGVRTALAAFVAEELDADWSKVRPEAASFDERLGSQGTGGSGSVLDTHTKLRLAGATMRQMLLAAAAQQLGVPASELATKDSRVSHAASNRSLGYGALADAAAKLPVPTNVPLRKPKEWRLLGRDGIKGIDVQDILHGRAKYGIDVRREGMLFASIERATVFGATVQSFDAGDAMKVPGVKQVVEVKGDFAETGVHAGVAVVATNTWAAMQGRKALKITWNPGPHAQESTESYTAFMRDAVSKPGKEVVNRIGDPDGVLAKAADVIRADYELPFLSHATMEPQNCTARVDGDSIEFWAPTQSPFGVFLAAVKGAGFKPENVKINVTFLGGGFGRRAENDYAVDAALIAKAVPGSPVKVIWTREDDVQHTKPRPLTVQRLEAGLDGQGNLVGLQFRIAGESIYRRFAPPAFQASGGKDLPLCEGAYEPTYHYPSYSLEQLLEARGVDVAVWRSVGGGYTKFALETFVEELAQAAGKDPIEFRLKLLEKDPRGQAVIREAMAMADWNRKRPAGRALGFAYSDIWETYIGMVAEVSVDRKSGNVKVHELWSAVDCGVCLQPANVRAQIESAAVWGVSALRERLTYKDGMAQQTNFHDYPVLRMADVPKITTKVLVTDNKPGGIGEVGLPPVAPAVANAVYKLTGKRLRDLPFRTELLKA